MVTIKISERLHKQLKARAKWEGMVLQSLVEKLLISALGVGQKKEKD